MRKHFLRTVFFAALSFLVSSCSSDFTEETSSVVTRGLKTISGTSVIQNQHPTTRGYWEGDLDKDTHFHWETGDQATLYNLSYKLAAPTPLTATSVKNNLPQWSGKADVINNEKIAAVYPALQPNGFITAYDNNTGTLTLNLERQTLLPNNRSLDSKYTLYQGDATAKDNFQNGINAAFHYKMQSCFWRYCFQMKDGDLLDIKDVTINNIPLRAKYNLNSKAYSDIETGTLTFKNINSKFLYVAHIPGTFEEVEIIATTTQGKIYKRTFKKPLAFKVATTFQATINVSPADEIIVGPKKEERTNMLNDLVITEYTIYNNRGTMDYIELTNLTGRTIDLRPYYLVKVDKNHPTYGNNKSGLICLGYMTERGAQTEKSHDPHYLPHGRSIVITTGVRKQYTYNPWTQSAHNVFYLGGTEQAQWMKPYFRYSTAHTAFLLCKNNDNISVGNFRNNVVDNFNRLSDGRIGKLYYPSTYRRAPYMMYDDEKETYTDVIPNNSSAGYNNKDFQIEGWGRLGKVSQSDFGIWGQTNNVSGFNAITLRNTAFK